MIPMLARILSRISLIRTSRRTDDHLHDVALVGLPVFLSVIAGTACYIFCMARLEKMQISPPLRISYEAQLQWWIVLGIALSAIFGGRLSAFIWNREVDFQLNPPPLRIYRRFGLVFCWSDNLTLLCTAPIRWMAGLYERCQPSIAVKRRIGLRIAELSVWMSRRRRRLRIRLLWLAHMARTRISAMRTAIQARIAHARERNALGYERTKIPSIAPTVQAVEIASQPVPSAIAQEARPAVPIIPIPAIPLLAEPRTLQAKKAALMRRRQRVKFFSPHHLPPPAPVLKAARQEQHIIPPQTQELSLSEEMAVMAEDIVNRITAHLASQKI